MDASDLNNLSINSNLAKTQIQCPLCNSSGGFAKVVSPLHTDNWLCEQCSLIFVDPKFLPGWNSEKKCYLTHQNGPQYPGYVSFLKQALLPTLPYLTKGMLGLDYGCGPVPTLSILLESEGLRCDNYDPFFYPKFPIEKYDFIFSTEAAEHFFRPGEEFIKIKKLLKIGGMLTIMTELWHDLDHFPIWYYAKDFTHVSFYQLKTIVNICELYDFKILFTDKTRVIILKNL